MHYYGTHDIDDSGGWSPAAITATDKPSLDSRSTRSAGSAGGYHEAMIAAEIANEVLRMELLAIEHAWAEEHASLIAQLARKDEIIWTLAQSSTAEAPSAALAPSAAPPPPKPPRIGHRDRPATVSGFDLRASGAMVGTPQKGKRQKPTYTVAKPAWDGGGYKSKAPPPKPKPAWPVAANKQQALGHVAAAKAGKVPTGKKKPVSPGQLKKSLAKPAVPKPPPKAPQLHSAAVVS